MQWLDAHISLHSLVWLFLAAFMVHDFEEIIFVESWMKKHHQHVRLLIPKLLRRGFDSFQQIKSSQFAVAVALEFVIFIPTTLAAADFGHYLCFIGFNAILLIHVFTHLGQSIFLKMYTPGVITAVFVALMYTVYLFYRLYSVGIFTFAVLNHSLSIGILILPLVFFGHMIGKRIVPNG